MRVALDIDDTITRHPEFFSFLSKALTAAGHQVYVISYRHDREFAVEDLAGYDIAYHELILPADGELDRDGFFRWKANVCRQLKIDVFFEDMPGVINELDESTLAFMAFDPTLGKVTYEDTDGLQSEEVVLEEVVRVPAAIKKSSALKALVLSDVEDVNIPLPTDGYDLIIGCGDLPEGLISRLSSENLPFLGVAGNHDHYELPPEFNLHRTVKEFGGLRFGGFEGSCRYKPRGYHLYDDIDVALALSTFPAVDVFVAHSPPEGIHDKTDGVHGGFPSFNIYILGNKPRLFLHGHVHKNAESEFRGARIVSVFGSRIIDLPDSGGGS